MLCILIANRIDGGVTDCANVICTVGDFGADIRWEIYIIIIDERCACHLLMRFEFYFFVGWVAEV